MSAQFKAFVRDAAAPAGELGLMHVTDCANLNSLLDSRKLDVKHCDVFNESLVYLFYGRPAYRRKWTGETTTNLSFAPICIVLKEAILAHAHRILPFDSGAFPRYSPVMHETLTLADFELEKTDHPLFIVGAFYNSIADYVFINPKDMVFPATMHIVRTYHSLISGNHRQEFDDRCATIEVQFAKELPLTSEVVALVGPDQIFDDLKVKEALRIWGADCVPYRLPGMFNPKEAIVRLTTTTERFLEDKGWI